MAISLVDGISKRLSRPSAMDLYVLCVQIKSFLAAGLALNRALEEIAPHQKNKELSRILDEIAGDMNAGMSAAEAFRKQSIFPEIFAPTIESGERASGLDEIFGKLGDQMWLRTTLYSKINSALLTPKIAGVLMGVLITGFAKIMIPQYEKMFKESGMEMPWIIHTFVNGVNGFFNYFLLWFLLVYGIYYGIKWYFKNHPDVLGKIKLKMPIYKTLHFSLINYQFASNLALMLNSGLNVVSAIKQTAKVVDNAMLKNSIVKASGLIQAGDTVRDALENSASDVKALDPLVLGFIDSGEKTGNLVEMLERAADIHKTLLDATVDKVATKITLVVILPMGLLMVGMYAISLVPMISYFTKLVN